MLALKLSVLSAIHFYKAFISIVMIPSDSTRGLGHIHGVNGVIYNYCPGDAFLLFKFSRILCFLSQLQTIPGAAICNCLPRKQY